MKPTIGRTVHYMTEGGIVPMIVTVVWDQSDRQPPHRPYSIGEGEQPNYVGGFAFVGHTGTTWVHSTPQSRDYPPPVGQWAWPPREP